VETYGGGLWSVSHLDFPASAQEGRHTWLDRDLGIAGRVITSGGARATASEPYEHHLIKIDKVGLSCATAALITFGQPLMRIPTLAIHLDREQNKAMSYNVSCRK
jgi:aspartyl aminopeptidase